MLFNSLHFALFFPIVVASYFLIPARFRWVPLLAASYYFYMAWRVEYALLMLASTLIDYVAAIWIEKTPGKRGRTAILVLALTLNLGLLFFFKYYNFAVTVFQDLSELLGTPFHPTTLSVLLPVGISFYTFQSMSYTIDVYRGQIKAERRFGMFALYVSFFPQLVAGPIERCGHLLPQFYERKTFDLERIRDGLLIMGAGFFKKVVIADRLAIYVNAVYSDPTNYTGLPFVIAAYAFTFQVFADFSGYSDIAIGSAKVMGYDLMTNFNRPFHARSMAEFWRRWHISLSTWFRDYIYFPMGGNRHGRLRHYLNVFTVFMISGLWHGANTTFVIWGALHGMYLIVGDITKPYRDRITRVLFPGRLQSVHAVVQMIITFHLFGAALILFRAQSVDDAIVLVSSTLRDFSINRERLFLPLEPGELVIAALAIVAMEIVHILMERKPMIERTRAWPLPVRWAGYAALALVIVALGIFSRQQFVYFQF